MLTPEKDPKMPKKTLFYRYFPFLPTNFSETWSSDAIHWEKMKFFDYDHSFSGGLDPNLPPENGPK